MRIKKVINQRVLHDQKDYVKGYIGELARLIQDLMDYADKEDEHGLIISSDIDSVDHNFVFAVLRKFGFRPNFILWVRTLLSNSQSCIMNNGLSTGWFNLQRGTRQDDPLYPCIFISVIEILLK